MGKEEMSPNLKHGYEKAVVNSNAKVDVFDCKIHWESVTTLLEEPASIQQKVREAIED